MMTLEEISQNLTDWFNENDKRMGITIIAEPDKGAVNVNSQIHGTGYILCTLLVELMKTDENLRDILKGVIMMMDKHKQKKSDNS